MANDPLFWVVAAASLAVLVILMIGIAGFAKGGEFNRKYSESWPVIIEKKDPLPGYEEKDGETDKVNKYFSEAPGEGS